MSEPMEERRDWRNGDRETYSMLVRLDERTAAMATNMAEMRAQMVTQAEFAPFKAGQVTQAEFKPIRMVIYGLVGILLTSVMGAVIAQVIKG